MDGYGWTKLTTSAGPHLACGIVRWVHTAGVGPMTLRCSQQVLGLLSKTEMDQEINQALANHGKPWQT